MKKVLIVDDDKRTCEFIAGITDWNEMDMEIVAVAYNGLEALEIIRRTEPDLVITDICMPRCDGLRMIEKTEDMEQHPQFIIISAQRSFEYVKRAICLGVKDYLLKPPTESELRAALKKVK